MPEGFKEAGQRGPPREGGDALSLAYYDDHPICEARVVAAADARRGVRPLTADDLFEFDQDHYGGLAAVDVLARRAAVRPGSRVLDVCAGLGGPARFIAARRGCLVTAVELHPGRAAGTARLTRRVGLDRVVKVVRADAGALPFADGRFDACISQEAFLHIPDKAAVLAGCHRILAPGGRLAFTDWIALRRLGDLERRQLTDWMAAVTLQTLAGYRQLLGQTGFGAVEAEDISDDWRPIVRARFETFRTLRDRYVPRVGESRYRDWEALHAFFVDLIEAGKLGGGRFTATR